MRRKLVIGAAALALAGGATAGTFAVASASGDDDAPVAATDTDAARAAAVQAAGPGSVAGEVEREDDGGAAWEVDVTRADGTRAEVRLDAGFKVVLVEPDDRDDGPDDDQADHDGPDDDGPDDDGPDDD